MDKNEIDDLVYNDEKRPWTKMFVLQVFQKTASKYPNRICLHFHDQSWTFKQASLIYIIFVFISNLSGLTKLRMKQLEASRFENILVSL